MRESDARKDGGTYGEHTTQYDEDRYQDEPEGKREDSDTSEVKTLWDADPLIEPILREQRDQAQAAPAHTPDDTARAIRMEQKRETARSIHRQASELQCQAQSKPNYEREYAEEHANHEITARALAETRAACDALAEALRQFVGIYPPNARTHPDVKFAIMDAEASLAQWEEAKK